MPWTAPFFSEPTVVRLPPAAVTTISPVPAALRMRLIVRRPAKDAMSLERTCAATAVRRIGTPKSLAAVAVRPTAQSLHPW